MAPEVVRSSSALSSSGSVGGLRGDASTDGRLIITVEESRSSVLKFIRVFLCSMCLYLIYVFIAIYFAVRFNLFMVSV